MKIFRGQESYEFLAIVIGISEEFLLNGCGDE